jgi:hypothetical protein
MSPFYKVVAVVDGRLVSPLASDSWQVEYRPGKPAHARVGKLFVFDDLEGAWEFVLREELSEVQVWTCEVGNPEPLERVPVQAWEEFWAGEEVETYRVEPCFVADSVTLREIVAVVHEFWEVG